MEYRGYDSAGMTVLVNGSLVTHKAAGKIAELEAVLGNGRAPVGNIGIGHTRWATHGSPTTLNAHPHVDCSGEFAVVHNGIIENAGVLRNQLAARGHVFRSETDTEIIAHLIEAAYTDSLEQAVRAALRQHDGANGHAVMSSRDPSKIVVARHGIPLLLGSGEIGEYYAASDAAAVLALTRQVVYLLVGEMGVLSPEGYRSLSITRGEVTKEVQKIWSVMSAIE
jgi:glucosamine--fructose-6-phosphate aminotransferase (isomerizing)